MATPSSDAEKPKKRTGKSRGDLDPQTEDVAESFATNGAVVGADGDRIGDVNHQAALATAIRGELRLLVDDLRTMLASNLDRSVAEKTDVITRSVNEFHLSVEKRIQGLQSLSDKVEQLDGKGREQLDHFEASKKESMYLAERIRSIENQFRDDLRAADKKIEDSFDRQWKLPKTVLGLVGTMTILYGVGTSYVQYAGLQDIRATARRLEDRVDMQEQRSNARVDDHLEGKIKAIVEIANKANADATKANSDASKVAEVVGRQIAARNAVHSALANTNLGHQQLVYDRNPRQALVYANSALKTLADASGRVDKNDESFQSVKASVLQLQSQALMEIGDHLAVQGIAQELIHLRPEGHEGYHYLGMACLLQAADESDELLHRTSTDKAIVNLKKSLSISERKNNPDLLFLAIAEFDCDHFQACLDATSEFAGDRTKEELDGSNRLGTNVQAKIGLSLAWFQISQFKLGRGLQDKDLQLPDLTAASIRTDEGRILESMLRRTIIRNPECPDAKKDAAGEICNRVREYCIGLLSRIQYCCGHRPHQRFFGPSPGSTRPVGPTFVQPPRQMPGSS